jgi:hypothetical protein
MKSRIKELLLENKDAKRGIPVFVILLSVLFNPIDPLYRWFKSMVGAETGACPLCVVPFLALLFGVSWLLSAGVHAMWKWWVAQPQQRDPHSS